MVLKCRLGVRLKRAVQGYLVHRKDPPVGLYSSPMPRDL